MTRLAAALLAAAALACASKPSAKEENARTMLQYAAWDVPDAGDPPQPNWSHRPFVEARESFMAACNERLSLEECELEVRKIQATRPRR